MPDAVPPAAPAVESPKRCAACGEEIAPIDAATCAICKREVHIGCLKPYGHHMLACEECRLEAW
jgi:hypothetical protein